MESLGSAQIHSRAKSLVPATFAESVAKFIESGLV